MDNTNTKELYTFDELQSLKIIKYYFIIRIVLFVLLDLAMITLCILLLNISKEINHFMYHAFDCCHFMF